MTDKSIPNPDILDSIKAKMYEFEKNDIETMRVQISKFNKIYKFDKHVVGIKDDTKRQEQTWHILRTQILVDRSKKKKLSPSNQAPSVKESITITEELFERDKTQDWKKSTTVHINDDIVEAVHMLAHVGEDKNIKKVAIIVSSRLVVNAAPESKNIKIQGDPGVGKDSLIKRVMLVLFPSKWKHVDLTTATATDYSQVDGSEEKEDDFSDYVLYYEDVDQYTLNSKNFRTMLSSEEREGIVTKDQEALKINYRKPTIIMTLGSDVETDAHILRRLYTIALESSEEKNKEIIDEQWIRFDYIPNTVHKKDDHEFITSLIERTTKLKKVRVTCPDHLKEYVKKKALPAVLDEAIVVTLNQRLIDFVKFSAALNQENRKVLGKGSHKFGDKRVDYIIIEADKDDADNAIEMFESYIEGEERDKWTSLDPRQLKIVKYLRDHKGDGALTAYEINELPESSGVRRPTTYNDLKKIVAHSAVIKSVKIIDGNRVSEYYYPAKPVVPD
jgi:hypothetical protein